MQLSVSVNAIVLDLWKITEPRKRQLKVEILNYLKELYFLILLSF